MHPTKKMKKYIAGLDTKVTEKTWTVVYWLPKDQWNQMYFGHYSL